MQSHDCKLISAYIKFVKYYSICNSTNHVKDNLFPNHSTLTRLTDMPVIKNIFIQINWKLKYLNQSENREEKI